MLIDLPLRGPELLGFGWRLRIDPRDDTLYFVDLFDPWHVVIPCDDISSDEVKYSSKGGNKLFSDIIFGIQEARSPSDG